LAETFGTRNGRERSSIFVAPFRHSSMERVRKKREKPIIGRFLFFSFFPKKRNNESVGFSFFSKIEKPDQVEKTHHRLILRICGAPRVPK
jgi:hypothetical protein